MKTMKRMCRHLLLLAVLTGNTAPLASCWRQTMSMYEDGEWDLIDYNAVDAMLLNGEIDLDDVER